MQRIRAAAHTANGQDQPERGAAGTSVTTVMLAWGAWVLVMSTLVSIVWLDHLLRRAGRADLTLLDPAQLMFPFGILVSATLGQ